MRITYKKLWKLLTAIKAAPILAGCPAVLLAWERVLECVREHVQEHVQEHVRANARILVAIHVKIQVNLTPKRQILLHVPRKIQRKRARKSQASNLYCYEGLPVGL